MKIYKTKKRYNNYIHLDITNEKQNFVQYVQRPNESGAKRKYTITLKLKQVCAKSTHKHSKGIHKNTITHSSVPE